MIEIFPIFNTSNQTNSFIVFNKNESKAIIINPADFTLEMLEYLEKNNKIVEAVFFTHNKINDTKGLTKLKKIYDIQIYSSRENIGNFECRQVIKSEHINIAGIDIFIKYHSKISALFLIEDNLFLNSTYIFNDYNNKTYDKAISFIKENFKSEILSDFFQVKLFPTAGTLTTLNICDEYNV